MNSGTHIHVADRKETGVTHGLNWVLCHCFCGARKFEQDITWDETDMIRRCSLDEIACQTNTDRSSRGWHDYCRTYDELFDHLREQPVKLLEMGVLGGDGLVMWSRYFTHPDTHIIGIDIETHRCQPIDDPRVSVCEDSQADPNFWKRCDDRSFDVIISDASHFASQEQASFEHGWSKVKPGGFYCIEDLHTWFSPQHCDAAENVMQWLTRIATEMQAKGADAKAKRDATDRWVSVDTLCFRKGLAIFRKSL